MHRRLIIITRRMALTRELEACIRREYDVLESMGAGIIGCRVLIERTSRLRNSGNPYRVHLVAYRAGHPEIIVEREPSGIEVREPLLSAIHNAFTIARRTVSTASGAPIPARAWPQPDYGAVVWKYFPDRGCGVLRTDSGKEVRFHRDSVVGGEFGRISEGMRVWYIEQEDGSGPRASMVKLCPSPPQ